MFKSDQRRLSSDRKTTLVRQRRSQRRRIVTALASSSFSRTRSKDSNSKGTRKRNPPLSPSLLEVIRLLLQRVKGSSYPNQDPTSIEDLKSHLRCRIAELEVAEEEKLPAPEPAKRLETGIGPAVPISRDPPLQGLNGNWPIRVEPVAQSQRSFRNESSLNAER